MRKRELIIEFLLLIFRRGKKAAPRFELGIKDLQSSALPLGHAAIDQVSLYSAGGISQGIKALLVISNGHGEDLIALRVLESIHKIHPNLLLEVMPLVGEGKAFTDAVSKGWLNQIGPIARLPSGGFSNQSISGLIADFSSGLMLLCVRQWRRIRHEASQGRLLLAVGDLFPLLLAWSSGSIYGFIGTPKSDYTWMSGPGIALSDYYHRLKGTEWDPWEWLLMRSPRCKLVAVRDKLTARGLRRHGVRAHSPGNPMMDQLENKFCPPSLVKYRRLILLCGSRIPEAMRNFERLLNSLATLDFEESIVVLVALGSNPSCAELGQLLFEHGYKPIALPASELKAQSSWQKGSQLLLLGPGQFAAWASWAEVGLTTAGTATEQLVGLGIPAVSLPGSGPQFKKGFAKRQSRLLGGAVQPFSTPTALAARVKLLLNNRHLRDGLGDRGAQRMGLPGGSAMLAELVSSFLLKS